MIDMKLDSLGFACVAAVPQIESLRSDNQKLRASVGPSGRAAMADTSLLFSLEQVGAGIKRVPHTVESAEHSSCSSSKGQASF